MSVSAKTATGPQTSPSREAAPEPSAPASPREAKSPTSRSRAAIWLAIALVAVPVAASALWYRASDNPVWPIFRAMPNWCNAQQAQLAPQSPDGRYRVHIVQTTCLARFTETVVYVADENEQFSPATANPDYAVMELAGARSLDGVTWLAADVSPLGTPTVQLWLTHPINPHDIHRQATRWRDVAVMVGESQPAPGRPVD